MVKPKAKARKPVPRAKAKPPAAKPKPKSKPKSPAARKKPAPRKRKPDPRRQFLTDMAELLRSDERVLEVRQRPGAFAVELLLRDGERTVMFLENYYQESSHLEPGEREARVLSRMGAVLRPIEGTATWSTVAPRLLPVLRSQSFFRAGSGDLGTMPMPAAQPFVPFVDLGLVVDEDDRMSYVSSTHLAQWGVTLEDALLHAVRNSARLAPPVSDDDGDTYHVDAGDDHESSRLAVPGFLADFKGKVAGLPIAIVPSRSQLWIGGAADAEVIALLAERAAREYDAANRSISPALYTVDRTGEVVPFEVDRAHPAYHAVRLGHLKLQVREYDLQKQELDAHHEHDGVDIFVASLNGIIRDDGLPLTWTLWSDGIDALLPVADLVCFLVPEARSRRAAPDLFVPFDTVRAVLGESFVPEPDLRPARFRVRAHPPADLMARLRAAAVTFESFTPP